MKIIFKKIICSHQRETLENKTYKGGKITQINYSSYFCFLIVFF